jgi:tetratricopeptide (TPR) repeat protein
MPPMGAQLLAEADRDSLRAVTLGEYDPGAWRQRSTALMAKWRFEAALVANDRAQKIDPTTGFYMRANMLDNMGRASDTLKLIASRDKLLDRSDPILQMVSCEAHVYLGEYAQAIDECERAVIGVDNYFVYVSMAAAYGQSGDLDKAKNARDELMRRVPTFTIARYMAKISNAPTWVEQQRYLGCARPAYPSDRGAPIAYLVSFSP